MNQRRACLAARNSQVPHSQGIYLEGREGFGFRGIHLVVGRGIQDDRRLEFREGLFHASRIRDIGLGAIKSGDFESSRGELGLQLYSELSAAAEDRCPFHPPIMYECESELPPELLLEILPPVRRG